MKRNTQKTTGSGGKCPHFTDNRPCRGCKYAWEPKLFDPVCLYDHPEALAKRVKK